MPRWCPFVDGETEAQRRLQKLTRTLVATKHCLAASLFCRITSMVQWGDSTEEDKCNLDTHLAPAENEDYSKEPASYHSHADHLPLIRL